jgi:ribosomal protein S18 acetylase RimI-like enzyme
MHYRPYTRADRPACLAVYDSNAERFFSPGDREVFAAFLDAPRGFFGVLCEDDGTVVGCGGIGTRDEGRTAVLTWGMVRADLQGHGLGRALGLARLLCLGELPGVTRVTVNTSNETVGFFEKLGFRVAKVTPGGYREGLDRYDLELPVDDALRQRLAELGESPGERGAWGALNRPG